MNNSQDIADIKFSIIIPVYNVEKYIERALDSVLRQTYSNFEVIIIDDESSDKTYSLCKRFIDNVKIKYVPMVHSGASAARNLGISLATGDYIVFVDGDDFIENDALNNLHNLILNSHPDCVICQFITEYDSCEDIEFGSEILCREKLVGKINQSVLEYICQLSMIFTPWRFIVKTKIVKESILFHEGIIHEDEEWCVKVLISCQSLDVLVKPYYHYVLRDRSVMRASDSFVHAQSLIAVCDALMESMKNEQVGFKKDFLKRCIGKNLNFAQFYIMKNVEPLRRIRKKYNKRGK